MFNLLLNLLTKQAPTIIKTVVNARRPLQIKAFATAFVGFGVFTNYDDAVLIVEYVKSLPQGNLLLWGGGIFFVFATKDVAGVLINFRRTLQEFGKTIKFLFKPVIKLCKKKQKAR